MLSPTVGDPRLLAPCKLQVGGRQVKQLVPPLHAFRTPPPKQAEAACNQEAAPACVTQYSKY
jgi:hypothetical protein